MEDAGFLVRRWDTEEGRKVYRAIWKSLFTGGSIVEVLALLPSAEGACGLDLRGLRFAGETVLDFALDGCDLSYGNFDGSTLHQFSLTNSRLDWCTFRNAVILGHTELGIPPGMIQAHAVHSIFDGAKCQGIAMDCGDFRYASFLATDLRNATMTNANCQGASFEKADLRGSSMSGAVLDQSDFRGALK